MKLRNKNEHNTSKISYLDVEEFHVSHAQSLSISIYGNRSKKYTHCSTFLQIRISLKIPSKKTTNKKETKLFLYNLIKKQKKLREIQSFKSNHKLVTSSCEYTENDWCYIIGFSLRIFFFKYWKLNLILGFFHRNETNFHWMLKLFFGSFLGTQLFSVLRQLSQFSNNSTIQGVYSLIIFLFVLETPFTISNSYAQRGIKGSHTNSQWNPSNAAFCLPNCNDITILLIFQFFSKYQEALRVFYSNAKFIEDVGHVALYNEKLFGNLNKLIGIRSKFCPGVSNSCKVVFAQKYKWLEFLIILENRDKF